MLRSREGSAQRSLALTTDKGTSHAKITASRGRRSLARFKVTPATLKQLSSRLLSLLRAEGDDPPSPQKWSQLWDAHGANLRFAWEICHKTKPQLTEVARKMQDDDETGRAFMESYISSIGFFEDALKLLKTAEARFLCAGSVAFLEWERVREGGSECLRHHRLRASAWWHHRRLYRTRGLRHRKFRHRADDPRLPDPTERSCARRLNSSRSKRIATPGRTAG